MTPERVRARGVGDKVELTCEVCGERTVVDATPTSAFLDEMERFVTGHGACEPVAS